MIMEADSKKPVRTCVVCRCKANKDRYIYISCNKGDPVIDARTSSGRGAYICKNRKCLSLAVKKNVFNSAFRTQLSDATLQNIRCRLTELLNGEDFLED